MVNFTHEYSNFPTEVIPAYNLKDVDNTVSPLVSRIKSLQAQGKHSEAAAVLAENKDLLKNYIIDTTLINTMVEEIRNAQIYAIQQRQSIFVSAIEPLTCINDDVWIGGE